MNRLEFTRYCSAHPGVAACHANTQSYGAEVGSGSPYAAGFSSSPDMYPEITALRIDLARVSAAVADNPRDKKNRALKMRLEGQLKKMKKKLGVSGIGGLEGLSDGEPISKLINTAVEGAIKVNDAIKGKKPTNMPPPVDPASEFPWKSAAITAGVAVAGYFLWKRFKKKGR